MQETSPKPFVFVLMPFDKAFNDIYQLGIKETCAAAGSYAERVDEQTYDGTITQRIHNQIAKADFIIADMTGRNPNVFYETGYAHALGKRVILLTQNVEDIPFDLKDRPHIVYEGSIQSLRDELLKWLRWAIEHPADDISRIAPPIQFFLNRIPLEGNPQFTCPLDQVPGYVRFLVDAHNSADKGIQPITFRVCVLSSDDFQCTYEDHRRPHAAAKLPSGGRMHVFNATHDILPGGWESAIRLDLEVTNPPIGVGSEHQFVLRMLTDGEPAEFPFRLLITPVETKK